MKYLSVLFTLLLVFTSCSKPPEKLGADKFFILLKNKQVDRVVIINDKDVEFTIKNSKEYPTGKWYLLPPLTDKEKFVQEFDAMQASIAPEEKAMIRYESRVPFIRPLFNYLLPILVFAGLVAGFLRLRKNR